MVAPVYNGELSVSDFGITVLAQLERLNVPSHLILVDDASIDGSWEAIKSLKSNQIKITGIKLQKNRGQHIAIMAGLRASESKWTIVMDSDLQEDPSIIPDIYKFAESSNGSVLVRNGDNEDLNLLHKLSRRTFYSLFQKLIDFEYDAKIANYGIYERDLVKWISTTKDRYPFFPALVRQSGFKLYEYAGTKKQRPSGKSTYTPIKLINHGISIILNQSTQIMRIMMKIGFFISILSFASLLFSVFSYLIYGSKVSGWYSVISLIFFFMSVTLTILTVIGNYVGNIFELILDKPIFHVEEEVSLGGN